ncbi:hypothetical protein BDW72DRAFT_185374 [Aspergillus terricola var. indicus]
MQMWLSRGARGGRQNRPWFAQARAGPGPGGESGHACEPPHASAGAKSGRTRCQRHAGPDSDPAGVGSLSDLWKSASPPCGSCGRQRQPLGRPIDRPTEPPALGRRTQRPAPTGRCHGVAAQGARAARFHHHDAVAAFPGAGLRGQLLQVLGVSARGE